MILNYIIIFGYRIYPNVFKYYSEYWRSFWIKHPVPLQSTGIWPSVHRCQATRVSKRFVHRTSPWSLRDLLLLIEVYWGLAYAYGVRSHWHLHDHGAVYAPPGSHGMTGLRTGVSGGPKKNDATHSRTSWQDRDRMWMSPVHQSHVAVIILVELQHQRRLTAEPSAENISSHRLQRGMWGFLMAEERNHKKSSSSNGLNK